MLTPRRALAPLSGGLLAAMLVAMAPPLANAQPATPGTGGDALTVNTEATFLRAEPNVRGKVVTRLVRGDRVEVLERGEGEWWRVRAGDPPREGYVHRLVLSPYVVPVAPRARSAPPPQGPPSAPVATEVEEPSPHSRRRGAGMIVTAGAGLFLPTARDSFDAVGITGNPLAYGGTVEAVRLYRSLFVRASVEWARETGERVFITDTGERFPLGIPLDVEMLPIEFSAGWRFEGQTPRPRGLVPYVGGGAGWLAYRETDTFADGDDDVDERFASYHVLAGLDIFVHRLVGARVEYRFRSVPDALGDGGVSAVTGDTSLGGSLLYFAVVLGR